MGNQFVTIDYIVFGLYAVLVLGVAIYMSREKKGHKKNTSDYFLASKALHCLAIGTSLIASNISAEQFIGMSGSGYAIGLAIASYGLSNGEIQSPISRGKDNLKSSLSGETELGLDTTFMERFSVSLNYSMTENTGQILEVPVSATTGFSTQWQNAEKLHSSYNKQMKRS